MKPVVVMAMGSRDLADRLFDGAALDRLRTTADLRPVLLTEFESAVAVDALSRVTVLLTGWDCPRIDGSVLDRAPGLKAIAHAAGTVKQHVAPECWDRGVVVSTAADANAIPVAEFTLGVILLAGKRAFAAERHYRANRENIDLLADYSTIGNYGTTVGIVGASRIGRRVISLLHPFDIEVLVSDPFLDESDALALGARLVDLEELARSSSILSVHAPSLPSTTDLINRRILSLMPDGATLINTARGRLVDTVALEEQLVTGRISAVLDVTHPEPLPADSRLFDLPNVVLTPHLAGAAGLELFRLGSWAVDEIERFASGRPFLAPVIPRDLDRMA